MLKLSVCEKEMKIVNFNIIYIQLSPQPLNIGVGYAEYQEAVSPDW